MRLFFTLLCLFLCSCASVDSLFNIKQAPSIDDKYAGGDAGVVLLSISSIGYPISSYYSFFYHSIPDDADPVMKDGGFVFRTKGMGLFSREVGHAMHKGFLYTSDDKVTTCVLKASLRPGRYEIYDYRLYMNGGTIEKTISSRNHFSIAFTVKPGEVTYIGNYKAHELKGFLGDLSGVIFEIGDKADKDVSIAKAMDPMLPSVIKKSIPAVDMIKSPTFVDKPPVPNSTLSH